MGYKADKEKGTSSLKKAGSGVILETVEPTRIRTVSIEQRQVVRGLELAQERLSKTISEQTAAQEAFNDAHELAKDFNELLVKA